MDDKQLRFGMIACGDISHAHANGAKSWDDIDFVACCDINRSTAEAWAKEYNCPAVYGDYLDMLGAEELDGVVLATWPNLHREQIEGCLNAGMHNILCEKSLTVTADEAAEVWRLVRSAGAFLLEAPAYFHHPRITKLRQILTGNDYGPVTTVRGVFSGFDPEDQAGDDPDRNWRQKKECAGGVPWDFACYPVNACGWITGALPEKAFCAGGKSDRYDVINNMHGVVSYENGAIGMIGSDKNSTCQDIEITYPHHIITLPSACWSNAGDEEYEIRVRKDGLPYGGNVIVCDAGNRFVYQIRHFADVITGKVEPAIPLVQSVVNMHVIDALVNSLELGEAVNISIPDEIAEEFRADT